MDKNRIVFESYNMAVAAGYNGYLGKKSSTDMLNGLKDDDVELKAFLRDAVENWESTPLDGLDGLTPAEYFRSIEDLGSLIEVFKAGAALCDERLPDLLVEELKKFGIGAVNALVDIACGHSISHEEGDSLLVPLMAIKLLGEWKADRALCPLIRLMGEIPPQNELLLEGIRDAFINIGAPAVDVIVRHMEEAKKIGDAEEYLLTALATAGSGNKTEQAYRCLKNSFLKMENKAIGAICLGIYGDGRAIPALRGFIEKNAGCIDRETFYEIKYAIRRLGGNADDLSFNSSSTARIWPT